MAWQRSRTLRHARAIIRIELNLKEIRVKHIQPLTVARPQPAQSLLSSLLGVLGFLQNIFGAIFVFDQLGMKKGQSA